MSNIVTNKFKSTSAENFLAAIDSPNNMYMFVGKSSEWTGSTVPTAIDSYVQDGDHWNNMISLKRISASANARYCIPTTLWTSGIIYAAYDDKSNVYANSFVLADTINYRVYKCIDNDSATASTIKPTGTSTSIFQTADGYYWKYMYTIASADVVNFLTTNWMPIQTLISDDSNEHGNQWTVQQASTTSGIEYVKLLNGGSGYTKLLQNTNLDVPVSGNTIQITLGTGGDNYYSGATIYMHKNDGTQVQSRMITSYTASTHTATVTSDWSPSINVSEGWQYRILPTVLLNSDGQGAIVEPVVINGIITDFVIYTKGTGYYSANSSITGCGGEGAGITVKISPKTGHGSNAVDEAFTHHVMISTKLTYNEPGFLQTNDYRKIGLVKNVSVYGSTTIAPIDYAYLTAYHTVSTTNESSIFSQDEIFTQTISSVTTGLQAKGIVLEHNIASTTHYLKYYQDETTGFTPFSTTTGTPTYEIISASLRTATIGSYTSPTVAAHSGDIIYIDQRTAIERNGTSDESYKIILEF